MLHRRKETGGYLAMTTPPIFFIICLSLLVALFLFILFFPGYIEQENKKYAENDYAKGYEHTNKLTKSDCYWEVNYLQSHYTTKVFKDGFQSGYFKWLEYDYQKVKSLGCDGLPDHLKEFEQFDK